jgi:Uma2 family endonuclease
MSVLPSVITPDLPQSGLSQSGLPESSLSQSSLSQSDLPQSRNARLDITWELLPDDYILPDDPAENLIQPFLAAFLNEILGLHGLLPATGIVATDFGICATVNDKLVIKAPDWVWIPEVIPTPPAAKIRRSYTPKTQGDLPAIVMEFLSASDCGEYSMNSNSPCGKWWFYERILQVPIYVIFDPESGSLEVYFHHNGQYQRQDPKPNGLHWLESIGLHLGVWQGQYMGINSFWLRWWDQNQDLLPCGIELVALERQKVAEERLRNEQLRQQLTALGIEPEIGAQPEDEDL